MKTKVVTIDKESYQLRKLDPVTGSFIYLRMMGVFMLAQQNEVSRQEYEVSEEEQKQITDEQRARMLITGSVMKGLSREDSKLASTEALKCVSKLTRVKDREAYMPIMAEDGRWADQSVADDGRTVHRLIIESLVFSLQPFFENSGSSAAEGTPVGQN